MPHTTKTWNILFVFNSLIKSCHSNNKKTNSEIVTWLMTSFPQMWHVKIFMANVILLWSDSLPPYEIIKVIKLFKKLPQRILGDFSMIIIISFYNNYYFSFKIFSQFWLAKNTRLIHHNQLLMIVFSEEMTASTDNTLFDLHNSS